jgi:hypothetical protein
MDWFTNSFGFEELDYASTQQMIYKLYQAGKKMTINDIKVGLFTPTTLGELKKPKSNPTMRGLVRLSHIVDDVVNLHCDPRNANATFQVASQMNCLEMANPKTTPEAGLTIYENDRTQGPLCAMSTPAGLAYRQYLYNAGGDDLGQTKDRQLDTSFLARQYLKELSGVSGRVQNGYLFFTEAELTQINTALVNKSKLRQRLRSLIGVGSHTGLGVFGSKCSGHTVNHVYCSGLPIAYSDISNRDLWRGLAEIFLESVYESTLRLACHNNYAKPCYLTLVGGGVFGMDVLQIYRAIERACIIIARCGYQLDVRIVHYRRYHPLLQPETKMFDGTEKPAKSVWNSRLLKENSCKLIINEHTTNQHK